MSPLGWLVGKLAAGRRQRASRRSAAQAGLPPVIVVGNVVVGGAGKTPVVLELARMLHEEGYRPGIVSRGYRGSAAGAREVFPDSDVEEVGDEALLLARSDAEAVWVVEHADQTLAARQLAVERGKRAGVSFVVIVDPGAQHVGVLPRTVQLQVGHEPTGRMRKLSEHATARVRQLAVVGLLLQRYPLRLRWPLPSPGKRNRRKPHRRSRRNHSVVARFQDPAIWQMPR